MPIAQLSSVITNNAGSTLRNGKWRSSGAMAAPIRIWRLLIIAVVAIISSTGSGEVHKFTAANSEPPAKFSPIIITVSRALMPFCRACAPKINANGTAPSIIGSDSRRPRLNSACVKKCRIFIFQFFSFAAWPTNFACIASLLPAPRAYCRLSVRKRSAPAAAFRQ